MRTLASDGIDATVERLEALRATPVEDAARGARVAEILDEVRTGGIDAVLAWTARLDGVALDAATVEIGADELAEAAAACPTALADALARAAKRIEAFHAPLVPRGVVLEEGGRRVEQRVVPFRRVGLYVPGGRAAYPSTVLMTAIPARLAGVEERIVVTPPRPLSPAVAWAVRRAGVTRVFRLGGVPAVGALAFGAGPVPAVEMIAGPGNAWVAEAKRQVARRARIAVDREAGPSEVVVIADASASPAAIAADLIAQAEHDPDAWTIALCVGAGIAAAVARETDRAVREVPGAAASIERRGAVVALDSVEEAIAIAARLAPEHLLLAVEDADRVAERCGPAGAVFVGNSAPVPLGDYLAGPSHALPTGGTAAFAGPLGPYDFVRRTSLVRYTPEALRDDAAAVAALAAAEGLPGHARAIAVRVAARAFTTSPRNESRAPAGFAPRLSAIPLYDPAPRLPVDLSMNEAPEDLPADLKREVADRLLAEDWSRYPSADSRPLREAIGRAWNVDPDGVLAGNGSNETSLALLRAALDPGDGLVLTSPTFSLYPLHAQAIGARVLSVRLSAADGFRVDAARVIDRARDGGAKLVLLVSPGNPTGTVIPPETVAEIADGTDALVCVDEAYREFAGQDLAPLLAGRPRLVLLRTLSKAFAAAGARIGVLLGDPAVVSAVRRAVPPYNLGLFGQALGCALLDRPALLAARVARVVTERTRTAAALARLGARVIPGGANFLLFAPPAPLRADETAAALAAAGVGVKEVRGLDLPGGALRATVGVPADNDRLLAALAALLPRQEIRA